MTSLKRVFTVSQYPTKSKRRVIKRSAKETDHLRGKHSALGIKKIPAIPGLDQAKQPAVHPSDNLMSRKRASIDARSCTANIGVS